MKTKYIIEVHTKGYWSAACTYTDRSTAIEDYESLVAEDEGSFRLIKHEYSKSIMFESLLGDE